MHTKKVGMWPLRALLLLALVRRALGAGDGPSFLETPTTTLSGKQEDCGRMLPPLGDMSAVQCQAALSTVNWPGPRAGRAAGVALRPASSAASARGWHPGRPVSLKACTHNVTGVLLFFLVLSMAFERGTHFLIAYFKKHNRHGLAVRQRL